MKQINHYHVNMFMSYLKAKNLEKGEAEQLSKEELMDLEKRIIVWVNHYNKMINFFVNNKVALWIKDAFYKYFGTPYPEHMYNDEMDYYITYIAKDLTRENTYHFSACIPEKAKDWAVDFSKFPYRKKVMLLKAVNNSIENLNKVLPDEQKIRGTYRYKKLMEYAKVG